MVDSQPQMRLGPVALRAVKAHVMAQQQLGQPGAARASAPRADPHGRGPDRADASASTVGTATRCSSPAISNLHQPLGIALIGLHAIRRPPRDQPRRAHQTVHPRGLQPPGQRETRRPRLIRRAHRTRQPGHELAHLAAPSRQPLTSQLPRIAINDRRHRRADMHIQRHERLSLRHGRHPHDCGPRRGHSSTANPRISCAGADNIARRAPCRPRGQPGHVMARRHVPWNWRCSVGSPRVFVLAGRGSVRSPPANGGGPGGSTR